MQAGAGAGDNAVDFGKIAPHFKDFAVVPGSFLLPQKLVQARVNQPALTQGDVNGPGFQGRDGHEPKGALFAPLSMREP
jgi:hypothetical protein